MLISGRVTLVSTIHLGPQPTYHQCIIISLQSRFGSDMATFSLRKANLFFPILQKCGQLVPVSEVPAHGDASSAPPNLATVKQLGFAAAPTEKQLGLRLVTATIKADATPKQSDAAEDEQKWQRLGRNKWKQKFPSLAEDKQKWQRLGHKWKQKFPWLDAGISDHDGLWGVGCSDCYRAKRCFSSFARYTVRGEAGLQCINFKKHDGNPTHKATSEHRSSDINRGIHVVKDIPRDRAVVKCIGSDINLPLARGTCTLAVNTPSTEEFLEVISNIQKGLTPGADRKSRAKQWCLLEAMKIIDQKHLEAAKGIALFRDESQSRLSLRFRSVGPAPKFKTYSALLGQARSCGTGAKSITLATMATIERACCRFHGGDKRCHQKRILKKPLFEKVKKKILCITVDSAGDELLSGEMMRDRSLGSLKVHTPNLKYVIRDCTHASRRLGSRPSAADPYLKEVVLMMARSRSSMARIIQNSLEVQRIFKDHCNTSFKCIGNVVANMRSALHRFESMSKPLGRSCIFLHAMIKTALTLATVRTDDAGRRAGEWLMWLDTEKRIQSAMMADAQDQNLAFTRTVDDETVDAAVLNREAAFFVAAIDQLFVGDKPTCLTCFGYTSMMLKMLSNPIVWTYKNKINSIGQSGGVSQAIIDACLRRMCNWVYLAKATVYAEFPNFEVVNAMVIFDPSRPLSEADGVHLERIALAINKSADKLRQQFQDIKPRAQQIQSGNNDGWALAVQHIHANASVARSHPTDVLEDAMLLRYLLGLSSSGVEQLFSKTRWALGKQRLHANDENEEMIIKLMADLPHHDQDKLIHLAQRVWGVCFNPPKQSPLKPRIDKGVKRKLIDTDDAQPLAEFDNVGGAYPTAESEVAFIRKRRRAIRQCVVKSKHNLADVASSLLQDATCASTSRAMEWTQSHDKELEFIKNKIGCRKACALAEGQLLETEINEEVREAARATRERKRKDCEARERKAARDKKKLQGLMGTDLWGQIKGKKVFIDRSVTGDHTPLIRALQANNMVVAPESEITDAAVFVTSDRGSVSQRVNLASTVKGAFQISPELVMSSGATGNAIKFFPAAMSKRCLYVSHAATQHHKELWSCFKQALASSENPRMVLELHENAAEDKLTLVNTKYRNMPRDIIVRPGEEAHLAKLLVVPNIYSHCNMIGRGCLPCGWAGGILGCSYASMCAY